MKIRYLALAALLGGVTAQLLRPEAPPPTPEPVTAPAVPSLPTRPSRELVCLAENVYHEARGEPVLGQLAVAYVTLKRLEIGKWGKDLCSVVRAHRQFSWVGRGYLVRDLAAWTLAMDAARYAVEHPIQSAPTHYTHERLDRRMVWMKTMHRVGKVGRHVFYVDPTLVTGAGR